MDQDRKIAYDILLDIDRNGAFSNLSIKNHLIAYKGHKAGFIRELVYGTLENQIFLDSIVGALAAKGLKGIKAKTLVLLRMGLYQIIFLDSVPNYAAINETVAIAKKTAYGSEKFVNGILRGFLKKREALDFLPSKELKKDYLRVKYSYSNWIIDLWNKQFDDKELEQLLEAGNKTPNLCIRANDLKCSREKLMELLEEEGFIVKESSLSRRGILVTGNNVLSSKLYEKGYFSIQDETSMVTADLIEPSDGDFIIDMCAAPGGKTLAIAEACQNHGRIIAMDLYEHKLQLISNQCQRLGVSCIETKACDATIEIKTFVEKADKVLADVPCSGLGVIRHKPEIKLKEEQDLEDLYEIQRKVLDNAGKYVKKGGTLVYSTCTINTKENHDQIERFLENNEDYELVYSKQYMPHIDNTDGFYIAKLIRK